MNTQSATHGGSRAVKEVVIIGGGFGGLYAAHELKNAPVQVTLIDRRNHHLFQPLLYQVATGALSPADISTPLREALKSQENARVVLGEVINFDIDNKQVILHDGVIPYDTLIVAAGSGKNYFGNDHWQQEAPGLKSLEDATSIRRRILTAFEAAERSNNPDKIREWLTFVVIGGGPTGVEMAGALAEIARETLRNEFRNINPSDARILLIQGGDRILPMYHSDLSERAGESLRRLGVEVITDARVTDVKRHRVTFVQNDEESSITTRTILWTAGVQASPLGRKLAQAAGAEVDRGGRVIVEADMSMAGHPEIFVIGDLAHYAHDKGQPLPGVAQPLPGVAQVAIQQGRYVGKLIKNRLKNKTTGPFQYHDRGNMAIIGRGSAIAEIGKLRLSGRTAWLLWLWVHLTYLLGLDNRILVFVQWMWSYVTRRHTALLITTHQQETGEEAQLRLITNTGIYPKVD